MIYSYRRVSTEEQHNGPQAQTDAIRRWAIQHYTGEVNSMTSLNDYTDFFDNGVSGSVPLAERPEGAKMMGALVAGDTVVTAKLDRLFRSVADAAQMIEHWNRHSVTLVAIAEGFDMTNPYGRAMAQMASVFAELERAMIRDRTRAALQAKKARGVVLGSEAPYGLELVHGSVVTNPSEQAVLDIIRDCVAAGMRSSTIAAKLNKLGHKPRHADQWNRFSVLNARRALAMPSQSVILEQEQQ